MALGIKYENGNGVPRDYAKAVKYYRLAAAQGDAIGEYHLGGMYLYGHGVPRDYDKALHYYQLSAAQGNADGEVGLGYMYLNGYGVTQNYARALHYYQLSAAQGNAYGEVGLGYIYQNGYGVTQDYARSLHYYQLSAAQGNALGESDLGNMYLNGYGATQDYARALHYYQLSAAQGNAYGEVGLGYMYLNGHGVTQDYATALHYYQLSAAQGNAYGEAGLGYIYLNGYGVTRNYAEALYYYQLSASQGNALGEVGLGYLFEYGHGVTQDYAKALHYYQLSAALGNADAAHGVQRVQGLTLATPIPPLGPSARAQSSDAAAIVTGKNAVALRYSQSVASATTKTNGFYDPRRTGDFDVLDGVRVNPKKGTVILYGHHDGTGAVRSVPYLDYLAAALESNKPTFSLEWTPASRASIDGAFRIADQQLTNDLGHVMENGQLTKRGEWWFRMFGADVHQGMNKMSLWNAVLPAAGYPHAGQVMKAVDELERAASAGEDLNQEVMDPDGHKRTHFMHFFNAAAGFVAPSGQDYINTLGATLDGDKQAKQTLISWAFRGIARAYKLDESRYINRYESLQRSGTEWSIAFAEVLNLSQDDTVEVQKNAFHALVGDRTFIHVPPDIMRDALGVNPVVVPVFQGLPRNSLLAKVAFDADVFGKNLMDMPEIKSDVPRYRTYFEWRQTVDRAPASEGHTWFAPHGFELFESADGRTVRFGKTPIRIYMESYVNTGASGRQSVADPLLKRYADELTALYEPLAAKFPVLLDLRESMKVMAIADWLKRKRIKLSLPIQGRGSWEPPATYPGVIHMEIAVKQAPVGEVMTASGGIDFRVDGNWNLVKEAIEAQPGPPPAHGVIIGYNPNSGTVTGVNPLTASAWAPSVASTSSLPPSHASPPKQNKKTHGPINTGSTTPLPRVSTTSSGSKPASVSPQAKSPTCSQTLADLRKEVSVIQKALNGLNQAMEHNQVVREESEKAIDRAMDDGTDKLLSAFIDLTGDVLDDRLVEATKESQLAVLKRMQSNISLDQRRQYDAAFKILSGQKKDIARVMERFETLETANNVREVDNSLANQDLTRLEHFYDAGTKFLGDPLVQRVFEFLKPAATPVKVGDAIRGDLEAGYLLGSEYLSWQNIKQLNKNTDQYLKAVKDLRAKLETVMKKIKLSESEMTQSKVSGCQ